MNRPAVVDPSAVGRELLLIVEVTLENDDLHSIEKFRKLMQGVPEIMQCHYVTGDADYVLLYSAASMEEYEQFTKTALFDNPDVVTFKTRVVMKPIKMTLAVPTGA